MEGRKESVFYYGGHITREKGGIVNTLKKIRQGRGNALQLFVGNPYRAGISNIEEYRKQAQEVKDFIQENNMKLFVHSPYVLNFAKDPKDEQAYWIDALVNELKIAELLGANGCVLHIGKAVKLDVDSAKRNMYNNLKRVIERMQQNNATVKVYVETAAGQGTELYPTLNNSVQGLAEFFSQFTSEDRKYLGFCVDTCHIFAAGYDISSSHKVKEFFKQWDSLIGLEHIGVVHVNNSTKGLGCRVDRHACLAYGEIPFDGMVEFIVQSYKHSLPCILETPAPFEEIQYLAEIADRLKSRKPIDTTALRPSSQEQLLTMVCDHEEKQKKAGDVKKTTSSTSSLPKQKQQTFNIPEDNSPMLLFDMGYLLFYRYHATMRNLKFRSEDAQELNEDEFKELFKTHLVQQLKKTCKKLKIKEKSHVFFCRDMPRATLWRTLLWPEYKATRGEAAPIIKELANLMNEVVREYGCIIETEQLEADDVAALIVDGVLLEKPTQHIKIVTNDRDYLQLLKTDGIHLFDANLKEIKGSGNANEDMWTKILMGDKSDNIPPVCAKCGKKTAETLASDPAKRAEFIAKKGCARELNRNETLINMDKIPENLRMKFNAAYNFQLASQHNSDSD